MQQAIAIYAIDGVGETAVELPRLCRKVAAMFITPWSRIEPDLLLEEAVDRVFTDPRHYAGKRDNVWLLRHPDKPMLAHLYHLATLVPEVWVPTTS